MVGLLTAIAVGCAGSDNGGIDFSNGNGDDGGTGCFTPPCNGGGDDAGNLGGDGGINQNGCSGQATSYVYVLSVDNDLYSFDPPGKKFTKIGRLGCHTQWQPNSMAIDRNANAYVNYVESTGGPRGDTAGALYKVSTKDASCGGSPVLNLPQGWYRVGMGYSTDSKSSTSETLFITATGGLGQGGNAGLAKVDLGASQVNPIGSFSGRLSGQNAELTGTGDAKLYGFFTTIPVQVAEIMKSNASTPSPKALLGVETPALWAFSFWGGHFYLYTCADATLNPQRTSNVTDYDPVSGTVNTSYMTNVGFRIVGAGVSTCAPTAQPK
jgi:hypothetical protein